MPVYKVTVQATLFVDQVHQNVYWLENSLQFNPPSYPAMQAALGAWITNMFQEIDGSLSMSHEQELCTVSQVNELTNEETEMFTFTLSLAGDSIAEDLHNQVSAKVYLSLEGGGRKARKSISGFTTVHVTGNVLESVGISNLLGYGGDWAAGPGPIVGSPTTVGVWSRTNKVFRPNVGTITVPAVLGSEDRRTPGRGI